MQSLENQFIEDTFTNGRFILSIGSKGTGKSYLMTRYLKSALYLDVFQRIIFICPAYDGEQDNQYDFLKDQKRVEIFKDYNEKVAKYVDKARRKEKTLFLIDDGSGLLLQNFDTTFAQLISTTRHFGGLTIYINVHSAKRILVPFIRVNIDYLLFYKTTNANLIKDVYEEYLSLTFDSFQEFKTVYLKCVSIKHNALLFTIHSPIIDANVIEWEFPKMIEPVKLIPTKPIHKPKEQNDNKEKKPLMKTIKFGKINLSN